MLDTVVLTFSGNMFTIIDHNKFSPSTEGLYRGNFYRLGARGNFVCKQNPTLTELKSGIYKPRLSVTKRIFNKRFQISLKVEFSIPKLIFGNNFDEIEEKDFDLVVSKLQKILKEMGVLIFSHFIINAPVSAIHYSKNILLTDGTTPYLYLKEFSKSNISLRLDVNQTDFRNEGHSLKFRTNSFEIVFYDKLKDLQKAKISEKRAVEKDNIIQLDLFDCLRKQSFLEVLRIEIRLNRRATIRKVLKGLGIEVEPSFINLFKQDISQKVLLKYFKEIENSYPKFLNYKRKSNKELLAELMINNSKLRLRQLLQVIGFINLVEEIGIRDSREIFRRFGKSSWYSFLRFMKGLKFEEDLKFNSVFSKIEKELLEFKTLKVSEMLKLQ